MPFDPDKPYESKPAFNPDAEYSVKEEPKKQAANIQYHRVFQGLPREEQQELSKQGLIGAASAIPGMVGDIESGVYSGARALGYNVEPGTYAPTSRDVAKFFEADEPETKKGQQYRSAGELLGGLVAPTALGKVLGAAGEALVGGTTKTVGNLANRAEKLGFKLEPRQLTAETPKGSPGFMGAAKENQTLANELASAETGVKVKEINPKFVGERLKDIGDQYGKIFGQPLKVDRQLATDFQAMADFERTVRPADVRTITAAADNVVGKFAQAQAQVQSPITAIRVEGEVLQRLRNEMSYLARTATDGQTRSVAGEFVQKIDANIARNHNNLVQPLEKANREYAATKALQELIEKGGIQGGNISLEQLGNHLAQNVYGFGAGTARHPLTELGTLGRELKMRGRFEGVETPSNTVTAILSKAGQFLNLPARMQAGRAVQRALPIESTGRTGAVTAPIGAVGREFEER
jgi:hypothetical protein